MYIDVTGWCIRLLKRIKNTGTTNILISFYSFLTLSRIFLIVGTIKMIGVSYFEVQIVENWKDR